MEKLNVYKIQTDLESFEIMECTAKDLDEALHKFTIAIEKYYGKVVNVDYKILGIEFIKEYNAF